jgi:hypothetical protein
MVNYYGGLIYKIECNKTGLIYIGSTCEPTVAHRLARHVCDYKRYKEGKTKNYLTSFEIIKNGDYSIYLVENYTCKNKDQLTARENQYIKDFDCVNKNKPTNKKEFDETPLKNENIKFNEIKSRKQKKEEEIIRKKTQFKDALKLLESLNEREKKQILKQYKLDNLFY